VAATIEQGHPAHRMRRVTNGPSQAHNNLKLMVQQPPRQNCFIPVSARLPANKDTQRGTFTEALHLFPAADPEIP
jgi:hypothetical protein